MAAKAVIQALSDAAATLMRQEGVTAKQAVDKAKKGVPGASSISAKVLHGIEKRLDATVGESRRDTMAGAAENR
jgi:hypothetical protein